MSSAHAVLIPSSVLNKEKDESISLKQLYTQFCLALGVIDLSIAYNSLIACSHIGLLIGSLGTPNASGVTHCKPRIL